MVKRWFAPDKLALTGTIIGLASLGSGWVTLKPNRLVSGTSLRLWEAAGPGVAAILISLWVVALVLGLRLRHRLQSLALGAIANTILVLTFFFAGAVASKFLEGQPDFARVALGASPWLSLIAVFFLIYAARQGLGSASVQKNLVSVVGVAIIAGLALSGRFDSLSVAQELVGREQRFLQELERHIFLFGISLGAGTAIGIPLGIWAVRSRRAEKPILSLANITQTIPSLALFGLLIAPLAALSFTFPTLRELGVRGVGLAPAVIALTIYSLLPIIRNTYAALRQLDPTIINAGLGMGMSRARVFLKVELPLAAPIILDGVRISAVQVVGLTTVAALIGAGGLGWFVFAGIGQAANDLILIGAIPIVLMALLVDIVMRYVVKKATPRGVMEAS